MTQLPVAVDLSAERPDLVRVFVDLLGRHPDALVVAMDDDGIVTAMPDTVPLARHRVADAHSVLDMIVPADKVGVITAWDRALRIGGGSCVAHLLTDPAQPVLLTMVDARLDYGVHLAMIVVATGYSGDDSPSSGTAVGSRTAKITKNALAVITEVDEATTQILGWERDQMIGRRTLEFIHPEDQERGIVSWMEMLAAPGHDQRVRLRHRAADGSYIWMEITNRNLLNMSDHPRVASEMLDISEELAAQEALRASEQLLRRLAEALPLGVVQIEFDGRISYANERLAAITGASLSGAIADQFRNVVASDRASFRAALAAVLDGGHDQDLHIMFDPAAPRHCTMSMRSLTNDAGGVTGAIVCVSDVSDQVRMTAELEHRATFDPLTGCFNRLSIMSCLDDRLADPANGVAIVYIDLDGFKEVNDDLGHAAGDALLAGVGALLREAVREGDLVGRIGGDEFLVVCRNIATIHEAMGVASRIEAVLERGIEIEDDILVLTASLGVAHTTDPGTSSDRLVADADTRMYVEKRGRKQRAIATSHGRPATLRTRYEDETAALRVAIEARELEVHYQPIVSLPSAGVVGLEALVRWRRAGEIIPAVAFIGLAERSGLITDVGDFVLRETIETAASVAPVRWFVNMSPLELAMPSKVADVRQALERHEVDPSSIVIEITEHSDMSRSCAAMSAVNELTELGVTIALDDFGTGYSSLAMLRSVPVSYLKFDRTFTADLGKDPLAAHLLETCRDLASRLGISLIAEGVETDEQRDFLIQMGVELAQGYLFSTPRPISELRDLFRGR